MSIVALPGTMIRAIALPAIISVIAIQVKIKVYNKIYNAVHCYTANLIQD